MAGVYALTAGGRTVYAGSINITLVRDPLTLLYAHTPNTMEASGVLAVRKSRTHTSRKTIRSQINDMYSDKVGAIVREITANADDSHRRAGQTRRFRVHCPTPLNPEFFVRDYGTGMTDAVMEDIYIVIGLSDKDESNDETGMWGLGSKSPFAYADQYTITCYDGETARHYGYGLDNDGIPCLYTLAVEPSTEECGVRIGLAVESRDFKLFEDAIRFSLIAHDGGFEHNMGEINLGEVVFQGTDWKAFDDSPLRSKDGYAAQTWWARQGCVIYPIRDTQLNLPYDHRGRSRAFVLDCPIGTIRMTPSREAIQYDPEVVSYLKDRVEAVKAEMEAAIEEATKDIVSVVDFHEKVQSLRPEFLKRSFTHPLTGLTNATLSVGYPEILFEIKRDHTKQWAFSTPNSVDLRFKKGSTSAHDTLYVVKDIRPLLDPSRGDDASPPGAFSWLTRSEQRRLARFVRHYAESLRIVQGLFLCNAAWTPEQEAAFTTSQGKPLVNVVTLTFEDLRRTVPRREAPPVSKTNPPIRGLALAKGAGEQKPVFEVAPVAAGTAWVSSDEYRNQAGSLFKLARKADIHALYIAAKGDPQTLITDAGYPHLSVAVEEHFKAAGWTRAEHQALREMFRTTNANTVADWLRALKTRAPDDFTKLKAGVGDYSTVAVKLEPYLDKALIDLTDVEHTALEALAPVNNAVLPTALLEVKDLLAAHQTAYSNPTVQFVQTIVAKKHRPEFVDAVLSLQSLIPPSNKI